MIAPRVAANTRESAPIGPLMPIAALVTYATAKRLIHRRGAVFRQTKPHAAQQDALECLSRFASGRSSTCSLASSFLNVGDSLRLSRRYIATPRITTLARNGTRQSQVSVIESWARKTNEVHRGGRNCAHLHPEKRQRGVEAAPPRRRILGHQDRRAGHLGACPQSLHNTQRDQQDRGEHATAPLRTPAPPHAPDHLPQLHRGAASQRFHLRERLSRACASSSNTNCRGPQYGRERRSSNRAACMPAGI